MENRPIPVWGLIASVFDTLTQTELYRSEDNGYAFDTKVAKDIGDYNLNFRLSLFDNFESNRNGFGQNAFKRIVEARAQKQFRSSLGNLLLTFDVRNRERENGISFTNLASRQSFSRPRLNIANNIRTVYRDGDFGVTNGSLSAIHSKGKWRWRGTSTYQLRPEFDISTINGEVRKQISENYSSTFGVTHGLNSNITSTNFQVSRKFDKFLGSIATNWSSESGAGFLLRASTSFGPYGNKGEYIMSGDNLVSASPILADIFYDENYDSIYNDGDEPAQNTKVQLNTAAKKEISDEYGRLDIFKGASNVPSKVTILPKTIEDPYLQPTIKGYTVFPRPGIAQKVSFPVVNTGAFDSTLINPRTNASLGGVDLMLLNSEGHIVQTTTSAPDGYFTFEFLIPDQYTLQSANIAGLGYIEKDVSITPDNLFNFGVNITAKDIKQDPLIATLGEARELLRHYHSTNPQ